MRAKLNDIEKELARVRIADAITRYRKRVGCSAEEAKDAVSDDLMGRRTGGLTKAQAKIAGSVCRAIVAEIRTMADECVEDARQDLQSAFESLDDVDPGMDMIDMYVVRVHESIVKRAAMLSIVDMIIDMIEDQDDS